MGKKITKALIPAAGFGTRFLPQTKAMPKEMMPLVDKPIIQRVVEELVDAVELVVDIFPLVVKSPELMIFPFSLTDRFVTPPD